MIRVLLFGAAGRMGRLVVEELSKSKDFSLVAGVECPGHHQIGSATGDAPIIADGGSLPEADVWIDFSLAGSALEHLRIAAETAMPIVVAATGFDREAIEEISETSASCPVLLAPNLSVGIGVMEQLIGDAASLLGDDFDPVLTELHHSGKRDAPSGTALRLAERLKGENRDPQTAALRAGGAIGEHEVRFVGMDEELVITHRAWSRRAFSRGVPRALDFIVGQPPGLYTMRDMYSRA